MTLTVQKVSVRDRIQNKFSEVLKPEIFYVNQSPMPERKTIINIEQVILKNLFGHLPYL